MGFWQPVGGGRMFGMICAAFAGICSWSLAEYFLHRFLGHDKRTWPNPFATEHTRHHSQGDYFAPTAKKAGVTLAALALVLPLMSWLLGAALGVAYAVAFVAMYVVYEILHRRAHTHPGLGRYGRFLRRHHFYHHFANPKANHGVTSPLWDVVFGTLEPAPRVRVPEKLAMAWLLDPQTGDVRREFSGAYELVRVRSRG
jgi:sterol desaturase/sphingolipid hydroxylase (fatty acid hydroxylase superfamily)